MILEPLAIKSINIQEFQKQVPIKKSIKHTHYLTTSNIIFFSLNFKYTMFLFFKFFLKLYGNSKNLLNEVPKRAGTFLVPDKGNKVG